jgi:hypothetical protein
MMEHPVARPGQEPTKMSMILEENPLPMTDLLEHETLEPLQGFHAAVAEGDLEVMRLDVVWMTTLLRSLSFALAVRSVESMLREEKDDQASLPPMSPEDWKPYA